MDLRQVEYIVEISKFDILGKYIARMNQLL